MKMAKMGVKVDLAGKSSGQIQESFWKKENGQRGLSTLALIESVVYAGYALAVDAK